MQISRFWLARSSKHSPIAAFAFCMNGATMTNQPSRPPSISMASEIE